MSACYRRYAAKRIDPAPWGEGKRRLRLRDLPLSEIHDNLKNILIFQCFFRILTGTDPLGDTVTPQPDKPDTQQKHIALDAPGTACYPETSTG